MFAHIKTLACAAAASLLLAAGANAATVNFTVNSVSVGPVACSPVGRNDTNCNYRIRDVLGVTPSSVTTPNTQDFRLFNVFANGEDQGNADSFSFVTTVELLVGAMSYQFSALASIVNWNPESTNELNRGARLTWGPVTGPLVAPLAVTFLDGVLFTPRGPDYIRADFRVQALESVNVVPLPGGIVLLLTAMAGLFGLSRRRKHTTA